VGFSPQPSEAERLIIGYQYALLRRTIPELSGTAVAGERTTLLLWLLFSLSEWLSGWLAL